MQQVHIGDMYCVFFFVAHVVVAGEFDPTSRYPNSLHSLCVLLEVWMNGPSSWEICMYVGGRGWGASTSEWRY